MSKIVLSGATCHVCFVAGIHDQYTQSQAIEIAKGNRFKKLCNCTSTDMQEQYMYENTKSVGGLYGIPFLPKPGPG